MVNHYLNGQRVDVSDAFAEQIELISNAPLSPNLFDTQTRTVSFPVQKRDEIGNASNIIDNHIASRGILEPLSYRQEIDGLIVFDGFLNAFGEKTYKEYTCEAKDHRESFNEWANTFNIRSLNPRTGLSESELRTIYPNDSGLSYAELSAKYETSLIPLPLRLTASDYEPIAYLDKIFRPIDVLILITSIVMIIFNITNLIKDTVNASTPLTATDYIGIGIQVAIWATFVFIYLREWKKAVPKKKMSRGIRISKIIQKSLAVKGFTLNSTIWPNTKFDYLIWDSLDNPIPDQTLNDFLNEWTAFFNLKMQKQASSAIIRIDPISEYWATALPNIIPAINEPDVQFEAIDITAASLKLFFEKNEDSKEKRTGEAITCSYKSTISESAYNSNTNTVSVSYSRAYEKRRLGDEELAYNVLMFILTPILAPISFLFGGFSDLTGADYRISIDTVGCFQLNFDYLTIRKALLADQQGRANEDNSLYVSAQAVYNRFWAYLSPKLETGQWIKLSSTGLRERDRLPDLYENNYCQIQVVDNESLAVTQHLFCISKIRYDKTAIAFEGYAKKQYTDFAKIKTELIVS